MSNGRSLLFLGALAALACNPRSEHSAASVVPPAWVAVTPPLEGSRGAECANWAPDSWAVTLTADSSALKITPAGAERGGDTLVFEDGMLVGSDVGEFGGDIWWQQPDGRRDTLRVQGRDSGGFYADNLHSFIRHDGVVYAIVGLSHLMLNEGELLVLNRGEAGWIAKHLMPLGGAPRAVSRTRSDTILVLTRDSLLSIRLDPQRPGRRATAGNGTWSYTYPSSLVRDRAGVVYIGMRAGVARLTPNGAGYREEWLVPEQCRHRASAGIGSPCSCEP